jgi:hypothetical protein
MGGATLLGQLLGTMLISSGIASVLWKSARDARHVERLLLANRAAFAEERAARDARLLDAIEANRTLLLAMTDARPPAAP